MSTLDTQGKDRTLDSGHGTKSLGPSDTSDSGSDVAGAGPLLGDTDLDGDTDSAGTGERAEAGRDEGQPPSRDIVTDRETPADDPSLGLARGPQTPDGRTANAVPDELG